MHTIVIQDVNDNPPVFFRDVLTFYAHENSRIGNFEKKTFKKDYFDNHSSNDVSNTVLYV